MVSNGYWASLSPYVDGQWFEFGITTDTLDRGTMVDNGSTSLAGECAANTGVGTFNVVSACNAGSTASDQPTRKLFSLAAFYICANPATDYFVRVPVAGIYGGDPAVNDWFPAIDYNVGQPKAGRYLFATGGDPQAGAYDSGTGIITASADKGGWKTYTLTDPSRMGKTAWNASQWVGYKLENVAGVVNSHSIARSGANTVEIDSMNSETPLPTLGTGSYCLGRKIYKIWAREFDNAVILAKPVSYNTAGVSYSDPSERLRYHAQIARHRRQSYGRLLRTERRRND